MNDDLRESAIRSVLERADEDGALLELDLRDGSEIAGFWVAGIDDHHVILECGTEGLRHVIHFKDIISITTI